VKRIEIGITHEVVINGDKSWIRLCIAEDTPNTTNIDQAVEALAEKVNTELIKVIEKTVETVSDYDK
jgi:hypothetical protein